MADKKKSAPGRSGVEASKPAGAVPPTAPTPALDVPHVDAETLPAAPPALDPQAGRTFKQILDRPISPAMTAKRGPGRPRKDSAKGDAGKPAERPDLAPARPGSPSTAYPPRAEDDLSSKAAKGLLQAAATIEGAIAGLVLKVDIGEAIKIWRFSPIELDLVSEPAAAVFNKHLPQWAIDWHEEIELAGILGPIMLNKIYSMIALKNPELLAQFAAAAMGGGQRHDSKSAAPASSPRPQPVPMARPAGPAPRTAPARPETIAAENDARTAAGATIPAGDPPAAFPDGLDFLAGSPDPLSEVRPSA